MARLTPSPQLGQQQQSEQHSNPQRNARCSGLTVREKQHVFRVEGSYTANLWAGMPASTSWAIRWMLGIVGRWSIPASLCLSCGQAQHPQPCPTQQDSVGKVPWYTLPLAGVTQVSIGCPGQGTGLVPALQFPSKFISTHPCPPACPCPTCPVLWPKLSPCLILPYPCPQSLIHSVYKEGDSTLPNQLSRRESSDFY